MENPPVGVLTTETLGLLEQTPGAPRGWGPVLREQGFPAKHLRRGRGFCLDVVARQSASALAVELQLPGHAPCGVMCALYHRPRPDDPPAPPRAPPAAPLDATAWLASSSVEKESPQMKSLWAMVSSFVVRAVDAKDDLSRIGARTLKYLT